MRSSEINKIHFLIFVCFCLYRLDYTSAGITTLHKKQNSLLNFACRLEMAVIRMI